MAKNVISKANLAKLKKLSKSKRIQKTSRKPIQKKISPTDPNVKVIDQVPEWRIPKSLFAINNANFLDALIFPMTKKQFLGGIYSKKAMVIRNQPKGRLDDIIEE